MEDRIVHPETAKLAKEKGFTDFHSKTLCGEHDLATQSLLQKFIREKCNIHIQIYRNAMGWQVGLEKADSGTDICVVQEYNDRNEYEDALEQGLVAALKRIKK